VTPVVANVPVARQPSLSEHEVVFRPIYNIASQGTSTLTLKMANPARVSVPPGVLASSWFGPALEQFQSAIALPPDWDTYGGVPASLASIGKALSFLSNYLGERSFAPSVVPLTDGGVQLVWHRNGLDVEATFPAADDGDVYVRDIDANLEHEFDLTEAEGREILQEAFQRLSA
jgi:hypothetical protein